MGLLTSNISRFRNDPRLFKIPPYLSLLCMIGGIIWICLLPLDQYSRRTYVSENALLPGQVHTYFAGSEQNIFRAYRHEVADVLQATEQKDDQGQGTGIWMMATDTHRIERLQNLFRNAGIKSARQTYEYESAGKVYGGENIYGIVHGPRADGTESIVLVAPIRNIEDQLNVNGVTLLLTLARYFSRWSLWSKDIILLITPDSTAGPQAWIDAYHSMHDPSRVVDLTLKSGHIQGAICIDYPFEHRFETMHVAYDGINGQLPNLDLLNTAVSIASGQMGIGSSIQNQQRFAHPNDQGRYLVRLRTLFSGMANQALGHATGAHSVFMPYHIDAITLTAVGNGWQDEMAFGRTVESMTRSLNNLLEKLHQSFFFYLLLQNTRFVSIGTYLPSAMAVGAGFTIIAVFAWVRSGYDGLEKRKAAQGTPHAVSKQQRSSGISDANIVAPVHNTEPPATTQSSAWKVVDRHLTLPITYLAVIQLLSLSPIYFLTHLQAQYLNLAFFQAAIVTLGAPVILSWTLTVPAPQPGGTEMSAASSKTQFFTILSAISLIILGLDLTVLATLNFSLSMFLGIFCAPLAFVGYNPPKAASFTMNSIKNVVSITSVYLLSPPVVIVSLAALDSFYLKSQMSHAGGVFATLQNYLESEAFAFNVWRAWGIMIGVWAVWVPAWIAGATGVVASFSGKIGKRVTIQVPTEKIGTQKSPQPKVKANDVKRKNK